MSAALHAELRELARQRGIVVWLDREGRYTAFADELATLAKTSPDALPVRRFRGSYLETMLDLEDVADGVQMTPLVIHVPGHTEDSIAATPLFELYRAGSRHRRGLDTLVREAAHGLATPAAIEELVARPDLTLEAADEWLARQATSPAHDGPDLGLHGAEALFDDLVGRGPVSQQLDRQPVQQAVWHRAETLLGLAEDDRRRLLGTPDDPGSAARTGDVATALAGWALCVELVHDLRREPTDAWLQPLRHLPRPAVAACQKLAGHVRQRHPDRYVAIATQVEDLLPEEVRTASAADLGKIDTFRFEDAKVMAAALDALHGGRFREAHELALLRTGGKSFWTGFDPRRRIAWHLVELAARLGCGTQDHVDFLAGCESTAEAVARYVAGAHEVDRDHRLLEQARGELSQLDLGEAETLRARLDDLRGVYREWADRTAVMFNAVCRRDGFLPPPALQQRTLFEDVVVPLVEEGLTAYVVVDGLRYELGEQLAASLRETRTADIDLHGRLAELPTVTEVGMNALAPVARGGKLSIEVKDGRVLGFRAGSLCVDGPEDRRRAIHERLGGDACPRLSLEEVVERDAASLRRSVARARAVVVHAEGIDKAGEKGVGLAVFERELQQLRAAWRVLYEAGVKRFVFTADHGFLLHDEATRAAVTHGKRTDPQRRHILLDHRRDLDGEVCVSFAQLQYEGADQHVAFPASAAPFDRGARAKDFVHGGNSLQERVIPVLTVRHRHAAGGDKATYEIEAVAGLPVAGMHSLHATIRPSRQANLVYGSQAEVELVLEGADDGVELELCDVHHARRTGAGVVATVDQTFQVFFRLSGDRETRGAVRLRPVTRAVDVPPVITADRFQVLLRVRPAATGARTAAPADWLTSLPEGVRDVFRHLADHGSINEAEAIAMLGGQRQFRAFSRAIDDYLRVTPFTVRIEMGSGGKCYVRETESH